MNERQHAESVAVVQIMKWRGICPHCGWHTVDELTPETARKSVHRHIGYQHEEKRTDAV